MCVEQDAALVQFPASNWLYRLTNSELVDLSDDVRTEMDRRREASMRIRYVNIDTGESWTTGRQLSRLQTKRTYW